MVRRGHKGVLRPHQFQSQGRGIGEKDRPKTPGNSLGRIQSCVIVNAVPHQPTRRTANAGSAYALSYSKDLFRVNASDWNLTRAQFKRKRWPVNAEQG